MQHSSNRNDKDWFDEWFVESDPQKKRALTANMLDAAIVTHNYWKNCQGPKLRYEELKILNYVFLKAPYGVREEDFNREYMVKTDITALTRKILLTVTPGKWVDMEIIDNVAHLRNSMQRDDGKWCYWYLPTWISSLILGGSAVEKMLNHISPNWMGGDLAQCERIYIPMNDGGTHWYLMVISFVDRAVFYVDTLPSNLEKRKSDCSVVLSFVQEYFVFMGGKNTCRPGSASNDEVINLKEWEVVTPNNVPNQQVFEDSTNCGIYVIHFMTDPSQIPYVTPWTVVTAKHRLKIIACLILWQKNNINGRVNKRSESYV